MISTKRAQRFVEGVGANIRAQRKSLGLNQTKLARRLKTDVPTVSRIETGDRDLRTSELFDVATTLGTTPAALVAVDVPNGNGRSNSH